MDWIKKEDNFNVPVKSWCKDIEDGAMTQAADLAQHPVVFRHVALMPDCHLGYGMPIGGVIACRNLGTLGGGNHFIEIQAGDDDHVWLMIHAGSRHLGNVIARFYNERALELNHKWHSNIPNKDLAFLPVNAQEGQDYIKDMNFALDYAKENRRRIMESFMAAFQSVYEDAEFGNHVNIHHNYAALEFHFDKNVWVHRKGATSAKQDETGIIPGSMGTSSYIVKGLGNIESFMSCSHGAGRVMGRMQATRFPHKKSFSSFFLLLLLKLSIRANPGFRLLTVTG